MLFLQDIFSKSSISFPVNETNITSLIKKYNIIYNTFVNVCLLQIGIEAKDIAFKYFLIS